MATTFAPFGLIAVDHNGGGTVRTQAIENGINSTYNITLYRNTPVQINASGQVVIAGASGPFVGSFYGYYVQNTGESNAYDVSPMWTSGTTLATNQTVTALVTVDPQIEYEIQSSGAVTQSGQGMQGGFLLVGSGNSATKQSYAALAALSSVQSSALRVIGIGRQVGPTNDWGDANTIVRVQIANHTYTAQRSPNV